MFDRRHNRENRKNRENCKNCVQHKGICKNCEFLFYFAAKAENAERINDKIS